MAALRRIGHCPLGKHQPSDEHSPCILSNQELLHAIAIRNKDERKDPRNVLRSLYNFQITAPRNRSRHAGHGHGHVMMMQIEKKESGSEQ